MKNPLHAVKVAASKALTKLVMQALDSARSEFDTRASRTAGLKPPAIGKEAGGIGKRFIINLHSYFDEIGVQISAQTETDTYEFGGLNQIDDDHLEAMVAMEGMIKQRRKSGIAGMSNFAERLESLLQGIRVDETNNPIDPEQIADCFNEAIKPLGLEAQHLLTIYRAFDLSVFGELEAVVAKSNAMLAGMGVMPGLETAPQSPAKPADTSSTDSQKPLFQKTVEQPHDEEEPEPQTYEDASLTAEPDRMQSNEPVTAAGNAPECARTNSLARLQHLLHSDSGQTHALAKRATADIAIAPKGELASDTRRIQEQRELLLKLLDRVQSNLHESPRTGGNATVINAAGVAQAINDTLRQAQICDELDPIEAQSADLINLVLLLFDAVERNEALPAVTKELVGRTRLAVMKIALQDSAFFDHPDSSVRLLINEFAQAGIGWTQPSTLDGDSVYQSVKRILKRLLDAPRPDDAYVESLLGELRQAKSLAAGINPAMESHIRSLDALAEHAEDLHAYIRQKIHEYIGNQNLDPFVQRLLATYIHEFLFKLVLTEGPEGQSWKSVVSTLDVMLWTMQPEKQVGDFERFKRVNPRLLENLRKFLSIGGASKTKICKIIRQLKQIQEFTFYQAEAGIMPPQSKRQQSLSSRAILTTRGRKEMPLLKRDDPSLAQIDRLPLGSWIEFRGTSGERLRCALASKIKSIDKLFFSNSKGLRVLEISRLTLAHELKAGTVRIVSEGFIMERAMESVAATLSRPSRIRARAANS